VAAEREEDGQISGKPSSWISQTILGAAAENSMIASPLALAR
jgi:hypothetical protein